MRLNLPERQACDLRALRGVRGNVIISALVGMILTEWCPEVDVFKVPVFAYYEG
jgi:hypothetical protein